MKVLFDAIYTKYTGSATLVAANTGGLHREKVPQRGADTPFIAYHHIGGTNEDTFVEICGDHTIQFNIYADTASVMDDLFDKLTAVYDYCSLSITGYTHVIMKRTFQHSEYIFAEEVWQYVVQYEIMTDKN